MVHGASRNAVAVQDVEVTVDRQRPVAIVAAAVALAVFGQLLFYGVPLGLNVALMVSITLAAAWRLRSPGARLDPLDAWLPVAAVLLAGFVAVRGDPALVFLDTIGALTLAGAATAAIAGVPVMRRSAIGIARLAARFLAACTVAAAPLLAAFQRESRPLGVLAPAGRATPVLRGVVIALPIVLVFLALFAAADAVFSRRVQDLFTLSFDVGELFGRTMLAVAIGWLAGGLLAFVVLWSARARQADAELSSSDGTRLGTTEALVVLVALDLLFAAFVSVQVEYLFGGRDTVGAYGFTYSEYARRGFFELVAVAGLAGALLMALERFVRRRSVAYVAAGIALCVLTGVVIASAAQRLSLYQRAFGWTELRFYVLAAIVWLGVCVLAAVVALLTDRSRWLFHAVGASAVVAALIVNAVGPQAFVARQNLARALDPSLVTPDGESGLDELYIAQLGDDAVRAVVDALDRLGEEDRVALAFAMQRRLVELEDDEGGRRWQAWNASRQEARAILERARASLEAIVAGGRHDR